ncbi:MAG: 1-acyl-sn-glycerol-3-phosphate acyltransferase [Chitinophagales bacterium]|jgi:1-acyl-sn-glycerol-3-phosphate acyltransferase
MRLILNIIQALLMFIWSLPIFIISLLFGLVGFKKGMMFIALNVWSPVMLFIVGGRLKIVGKENIDLEHPNIYVANHNSHFDIPILFYGIRIPLFFIAKKELKKIPIFGIVNTLVGTIWLDRSNKSDAMKSIHEAGNSIKNGKNVITFPEGTRSKDGSMAIFRKGTFVLAQQSNIDIIPIGIIGARPLNPPGKFKFTGSKVTLVIGKKIKCSDYTDKTAVEFANHAQAAVVDLIKQNR